MSALRTIARNGAMLATRRFVHTGTMREKPLAACRRIARNMLTEHLRKSIKQPPLEVSRSPKKSRYWVAVVNDELVSREALDNARRKMAIAQEARS